MKHTPKQGLMRKVWGHFKKKEGPKKTRPFDLTEAQFSILRLKTENEFLAILKRNLIGIITRKKSVEDWLSKILLKLESNEAKINILQANENNKSKG